MVFTHELLLFFFVRRKNSFYHSTNFTTDVSTNVTNVGFPLAEAGRRSLVFDLNIAHDRFGSSSHMQHNGCLSHPQDLDAPLRIAARRRLLTISNNTLTIRIFLLSPRLLVPPPACMASFCVFFFYRPTGRLRRHTSLLLECHRKPTTRKHSGSRAMHSTTA